MMMSKHMIGQCQWQTSFDDQTNVTQLQDALSQWSNQILPSVLNSVFERYCPAAQTWRIEQLHIDLGTLALSELDTQLPIKVAAALEQALLKMLQRYGADSQSGSGNKMTIVGQDESELALLRWFLLYGVSPWWVVGNNSPLHVVDAQMSQQPNALASLIRDVGHRDAVRRRIVWQWGEARTRKTVQILEPWNAQFICSYADNILLAQQQPQSRIPKDSNLQTHLWYWVLTHLLVDRGTLFNTSQFVRATLWQMAQHYQLSFHDLLEQMSEVAKRMQETGLVAPQFLQVLIDIQRSEQQQLKDASKVDVQTDLWSIFSGLLHDKQASIQEYGHTYHLTELFTRLAQVEPSKMALALKQEGQAEAVRVHIVKQFNEQQLAHIVDVVAPHDTSFILAHVSHTQTLLKAQHLDPEVIWRVLLAYLFVNRGSYFNRRQFVHTTLSQVSQHFGVDYHLVLLLLQQTNSLPSKAGQQYELFTILADLQQRQAKQEQHNDTFWLKQYGALIDEQVQHSSDYPSLMFGQLNTLSWQHALRGMIMVRPVGSPRSLYSLLKRHHLGVSQRYQLAQKLVAAMTSSGMLLWSDVKQLIHALSPNYASESIQLISALHNWQQQGLMPQVTQHWSLTQLIESIAFSLLNQPEVNSIEQWFIRTTGHIAQRFSLSHSALLQQIWSNVQLESQPHEVLEKSLVQSLKGALSADLLALPSTYDRVPEHVIYAPLSYSLIKTFKALALRFNLPTEMVLKLCAEFACKGGLHKEIKSFAELPGQKVTSFLNHLATHFVLPVTKLRRYLVVQFARTTSMRRSVQKMQDVSADASATDAMVGKMTTLVKPKTSRIAIKQISQTVLQMEARRQAHTYTEKNSGSVGEMTSSSVATKAAEIKSIAPLSSTSKPANTVLVLQAQENLLNNRIRLSQQAYKRALKLSRQSVSELLTCLLNMRGSKHVFIYELTKVADHKDLLNWLLNPFDTATKACWLYRLYLASESGKKGSVSMSEKPLNFDELFAMVVKQLRDEQQHLGVMIVQKVAVMSTPNGQLKSLLQSPLLRSWLRPVLPDIWQGVAACDKWCQQIHTWLHSAIAAGDESNLQFFKTQHMLQKNDAKLAKSLFWQLLTQHFNSCLHAATRSLHSAMFTKELATQLIAILILRWTQAHSLNLALSVAQLERYSQSKGLGFVLPQSSWTNIVNKLKRVTNQGSFTDIAQNLSAQSSADEHTAKRLTDGTSVVSAQASRVKQADLHKGDGLSREPKRQYFDGTDHCDWRQDFDGVYLNRSNIKAIFEYWLCHGVRPHFIDLHASFSGARLLNDMQLHKPKLWCDTLAPLLDDDNVRARVANHITLLTLLDALTRAGKLTSLQLTMFSEVEHVLKAFASSGIALNEQECEQFLLICLLRALANNELAELSAESLLQAICWQLVQHQVCSADDLARALGQDAIPNLPHVMNALSELRKQLSRYQQSTKRHSDSPLQHEALAQVLGEKENNAPEQPTEFPMSVPNAGLVLIQSFIPHLFERLGLVSDDKFVSEQKQRAAVHYLQFLVTGQSATEEHHLILNKLMCGYGVTQPVEAGVTLSQSDIDTIHSLIEAVCNYWPAIGKTSVDGFRGNWLVRNGTLTEAQDHWDLIVEKRVYDILISRSPLSYSIVKLPWMEKPIYVTWPT
ncbi:MULTISPECIES: contractile injection system tape measure protein [Pseudoalteromonas]|uniref:Uncharacterized protein n=1 Tax=Pseudoalteromonas amylolytica TaxID=1859457 RepID=A0A1S1MSJ2_9GAMM|nr:MULTISPECIES: contractile injection system tape measure protein [Pseudoalteromonas]OHU84956.1 hypothetical protein BFC16_19905 [Pseudoalteromonas sp. JW3]OHU90093.1 hypothetical protein BET10_15070 [Pseudoalteromonas amylolytica]